MELFLFWGKLGGGMREKNHQSKEKSSNTGDVKNRSTSNTINEGSEVKQTTPISPIRAETPTVQRPDFLGSVVDSQQNIANNTKKLLASIEKRS